MAEKLQNLKATQISFNTELKENVWCSINLRQNDSLISECIYRSPISSCNNLLKLLELMGNVSRYRFMHVLVVDDFNMKEIYYIDYESTKR